jgi:hypothetical protein
MSRNANSLSQDASSVRGLVLTWRRHAHRCPSFLPSLRQFNSSNLVISAEDKVARLEACTAFHQPKPVAPVSQREAEPAVPDAQQAAEAEVAPVARREAVAAAAPDAQQQAVAAEAEVAPVARREAVAAAAPDAQQKAVAAEVAPVA